jgi:hypothetical protein
MKRTTTHGVGNPGDFIVDFKSKMTAIISITFDPK